jgi:peptide deformylase
MRGLQVFGSPILRRVSKPLGEPLDKEFLLELLNDMERVLALEEGVGLAAPQVGENVRVFILESTSLLSVCGHRVFVNPVLRPSGPLCRREEGCLSVPGIFEDVVRPSQVAVSALDENGDRFELQLEGMAARAAQHENDHLEGMLFVDRLGSLRRRLLRGRLAAIADAADGRSTF